jgi:hypothetical protein
MERFLRSPRLPRQVSGRGTGSEFRSAGAPELQAVPAGVCRSADK